jgi:uncharacterized protein
LSIGAAVLIEMKMKDHKSMASSTTACPLPATFSSGGYYRVAPIAKCHLGQPSQALELQGEKKMSAHYPVPPFTHDTAIQKVRLAEDGWNSRNPEKVALAYTPDSRWRNRAEFVNGRQEIVSFLARKWTKELDYRLIKELWAFTNNRIAVRFAYEWHDDSGNWFRSYGNENWEFDESGLMRVRLACINDLPIPESERKYHWPLGRRPDDHPGLSDLGF